jgi:uroporphyrinogen decarboxylase
MSEMTSRERVLAALNHQEPDRVPTALGGGPYGIVDSLYLRLLDHLELGRPVSPFRRGHNISYMDDRLLDRLGTDIRYVWPGASPSSPALATGDPNTMIDGYGQPWKKATPYYYAEEGILKGAGIDDIERIVTWPDASDPRWVDGVQDRARSHREESSFFVAGRMVTSHGPFQTACNLRGTEQFLIDLAIDEAFADTLIEQVTDSIDALLRGYLEAGGDYFDLVELPGDDYAGNKSTIISMKMFRRYFKPSLARLVNTIKSFNANIKVMFHSDGMILPLLPDLIEIGVDLIHPLEPVPAMDLADVKARYGSEMAFLGGIDIMHAMRGSQQDVQREARRRIQQLAPGGGYILAPSNHLQADVPPENVLTLYQTAHQAGRYPL